MKRTQQVLMRFICVQKNKIPFSSYTLEVLLLPSPSAQSRAIAVVTALSIFSVDVSLPAFVSSL